MFLPNSFGYDQTNVDAYQLISIKGKTGVFREVALQTVEGF